MNLNEAFGAEQAAGYDDRFTSFAPFRASLFLSMRAFFSSLPEDAHILSVGAGTGADLMELASAFPKFTFTAVEPAGAMLEICRKKAHAAGVHNRCEFHEGFLSSLPPGKQFHGATSILFSHFIVDKKERRQFFSDISARLRPDGLLISADLSANLSSPEYDLLMPVWLKILGGGPEAERALRSAWASVGILPPLEVAGLIESAGFAAPALFHQTLFIHAWVSRKSVPGSSAQ
jgi:tRNA (cmo5U34)-methyltransferase